MLEYETANPGQDADDPETLRRSTVNNNHGRDGNLPVEELEPSGQHLV